MSAGAVCSNCGAALEGPYCHLCGQAAGSRVKLLGELVRDVAGDTLGYDSRAWRTLKTLVLSPGKLSNEYVLGRRARYTTPFRLYLVTSVLAFLFLSHVFRPNVIDVRDARSGDAAVSAEVPPASGASNSALARKLRGNVQVLKSDPDRYVNAVLRLLSQMMFVLLPIFAAVMLPFYASSGRYYIEHLTLLMHNHAFVFLAVLVSWPVSALRGVFSSPLGKPLDWLMIALWTWVLVYILLSMKRFYRQGWALTLLKYVTLTGIYAVLFVVGIALVTVGGLLTL